MPSKGPYVNVRMVDGKSESLPGTVEEIASLLKEQGPLVTATNVYGQPVLINAAHVISVHQLPAADFGE